MEYHSTFFGMPVAYPTTRKRAPRSPKSVRLIVERHYIGNVPMNTLFQRLAEEEIRKTAESYLAAG